MADRNLERLERGLRAFAARDLAALRELFHEDVLWHYGGSSCLAGDYHGLDEVFELFARRAALSHESYRLEVKQAIANDDFVTVIGRTRAKREDASYEDSIVLVYRIEGERVVEAWAHPARPEAERAFYG
jgi:ketosteroid isomerase-like protein